jgi:hypothetical protein
MSYGRDLRFRECNNLYLHFTFALLLIDTLFSSSGIFLPHVLLACEQQADSKPFLSLVYRNAIRRLNSISTGNL